MTKICLIAALAKNNAIGRDNKLLWDLPADMAWFRKVTAGKPVIMGRKTFDSIGRALPKRLNIIISRTPQENSENVMWVSSLDEALSLARAQNTDEIMVIGGGQIYTEALPRADILYLTEVDDMIDGDSFFPVFDKNHWQRHVIEAHAATKAQPAFEIVRYER